MVMRFVIWWRRWVVFLRIVPLLVPLIDGVGVGMICFKQVLDAGFVRDEED
jgi:hypothetical protein